MSKIIFISNRLPITLSLSEDNIEIKESIGGLATGLKGYHQDSNNLWLGWAGVTKEEAQGREEEITQRLIKEHRCIPLFLSEEDLELYYQGFSNSTLWPLFHYFPNLTTYDEAEWQRYKLVNEKFLLGLKGMVDPGDSIWIHDYQLMLLPHLIREEYPHAALGFFLHIPFPSYELFRLLPWRDQVLEGLLGADLIGFHTYDYARHFLSSVRRIMGYEQEMNVIKHHRRSIRTDVFPMGIDYEYFTRNRQDVQHDMVELLEKTQGTQVIFSVDRLDYTKGIPGRILAYAQFLKDNPEYREKVTLILIVAPSRTQVDLYSDLLREIQELVSGTNGQYGTLGWIPIWYFYRSFSQDSLIAIYKITDAMLVTPLRDGMNLVAKEFIASRTDKQGMLVISETAGASSELGEAVVVNSNNLIETANGIKEALDMTKREQIERNTIMHNRLKRYNIYYWAKDFLDKLLQQHSKWEETQVMRFDNRGMKNLLADYKKAKSRLIFLDYDGTLMGFKPKPDMAFPDEDLLKLLKKLKSDPRNHLVIISGRDKDTLEKWLGELEVDLVASHGLWVKEQPSAHWEQTEVLDNSWKDEIRPLLEVTMDRTPGSLVEEKEFSLAWHYRKCEPELAQIRLRELTDTLLSLTGKGHLGLLDGNKVLEIKDTTVNKGRTAGHFIATKKADFVFAAGDDTTDEDLFSIIDENQYSFKIGQGETKARFYIRDCDEFRSLLTKLSEK
ncbi:MAG: bifunctional alpha,alpha-trehalose-phosphate synthase (UDP-forming)/trehalose-phosphatase [Spirochaetaceae bacterium]|jgi:trehalose 6-phosphate synthase/phosphatase|nr:bifunctional alpha,alpha-trehalose-phosphate synthase (UDP-forming)/trehalose-phosphatase [Spirochaetaceae bacterium]